MGEEEAARWLKRHGVRVIERNVRTKLGEIDLIARDGDTLVFIEVKTRRGEAMGPPAAAVTPPKQRRIGKLAQAYMQRRRLAGVACRFDVVGVLLGENDSVVGIQHLPNAFDVPIL